MEPMVSAPAVDGCAHSGAGSVSNGGIELARTAGAAASSGSTASMTGSGAHTRAGDVVAPVVPAVVAPVGSAHAQTGATSAPSAVIGGGGLDSATAASLLRQANAAGGLLAPVSGSIPGTDGAITVIEPSYASGSGGGATAVIGGGASSLGIGDSSVSNVAVIGGGAASLGIGGGSASNYAVIGGGAASLGIGGGTGGGATVGGVSPTSGITMIDPSQPSTPASTATAPAASAHGGVGSTTTTTMTTTTHTSSMPTASQTDTKESDDDKQPSTEAKKPATIQKKPAAHATKSITIKSGDTLSQLAARYKTSVSRLMDLNPSITNANLIRAGASLKVPA
jgi:LysM repeat protein